ncbi:MAG: hypothetical protein L6Q66_13845 [Bacteroidia bacterium]|nr:hypothetical protein [Bacteroidia bacterium]
MSRIFVTLIFTFILSLPHSLLAQCKIAEIVKNTKTKIEKPYLFDGFTTTNLSFTQQKRTVRSEFMAFKGQKYRLHFCSSEFEETVKVVIKQEQKNGTLVEVFTGSVSAANTYFSFDIEKPGTYFIDFEVPERTLEVDHKECVIMLNSYKTK